MKTRTRIKWLSAAVLLLVVAAVLNFTIPAVSKLTPAISTPLIVFPKAPAELTAAAGINLAMNWQVKLDWKDNSGNETSFKIYRMTSGASLKIYTAIGTVAANTTTYTDLDVDLGKTYFYYVASANSAGESKSEVISSAVTDSAPKPPTDLTAAKDSETEPTKVTITWNDKSDNENGFKIYRRDSAGSTSFKLIKTLNANSETFADSEISPDLEGRYYIYRLFAFNDIDETTSVTGEYPVPFRLKAPTGLNTAITSTTADLTWKDNSAKESYYAVYRCTDGVNYQLIAGTGHEVSYHDANLMPNTLYYYAVVAVFEADSNLGSQKVFVTAKTALASSSPASSGSGSSLSGSSGAASSKAPSSAASTASAASATKSAVSSKAKSSEQTVSAVSENPGEPVDAITSDSVTSGVLSQEERSVTATIAETVRQNALLIIGAAVIILLVVVIILLSIKRRQK
ncbi:MAG TPA: hypothetical protein PK854_11930 [Oscillospiraceae bacterium]|nr:hypothetical protein [Oscillospiraceae bacterium]HPS35961.1 hypothetical protein [Oscillospiraceae bacterium]